MSIRPIAPTFALATACALVCSISACSGESDLSGPGTPAIEAGEDAAGNEAGDGAPDASEELAEDASPDTSFDGATDTPVDQAPTCAPPSDPSKAALCVRLTPEQLTLVPGDPALDGQGLWIVQLYDSAAPQAPDGGEPEPLAMQILPAQDAGTNPPTLMGIYDDVGVIRFEGLPTTVYARAIFLDNLDALQSQGLAAGIWIGGQDTTQGLFGAEALMPVQLASGQGTDLVMPVSAFRRMRLKLRAATGLNPLGDGQGPAAFILFQSQQVGDGDGGSQAGFGYGTVACGDLKASVGIDVEGVFLGPGPYYALGIVDDFGTGMDQGPGPGSILDLELTGSEPQLPASSKLTIPSGAYDHAATLELSLVIPFSGLPPTDTITCTSIADAGAD